VSLVLAAALMQLASALPPVPPGSTFTPPDYLKPPPAKEMSALYPSAAARDHLTGSTVIGCVVTAQGTLEPCRVVAEAPKGKGFGDAALAMAKLFHCQPAKIDGRPVGGGFVRIPLDFSLNAPRGWPWLAWRDNVEGHVVLSCTLNALLHPMDCAVKSETPRGYTFGDFAVVRSEAPGFGVVAGGHAGDRVDVPVDFKRSGAIVAGTTVAAGG
jgi:TonB family protein